MALAATIRSGNEGGFFRRAMSALLGSSTLSPSTGPSRMDSFGVLAVKDIPTVHNKAISAEQGGFTISEARRRLSSFVNGGFAPQSLPEMMSHLASRFLRLEARTYGANRPTNYLIDEISQSSVPAAQVDKRLGSRMLAKIFGRDLTEEARLAQQVKDPDAPLAKAIRSVMDPFIAQAPKGPAFGSWDELRFMSPILLNGREYTVQGKRGYFGKAFGHASDDPQENLKLMRQARNEGVSLVIPATSRENALKGILIPGMPILDRKASVPAEKVHARFDAQQLTQAYRQSIFENYEAMSRVSASKTLAATPSAKVVNLDDFKKEFLKPAAPVEQPQVDAFGFGMEDDSLKFERIVIRSEISASGEENLLVWDTSTDSEVPMDIRNLPEGNYTKEDAFGIPAGSIAVGDDGAIMHYNEEMQPHNAYGPAIIPSPSSLKPSQWALDGKLVTAEEFKQKHAALFESERTYEMDEPKKAFTFG